MDPLLEIVLSVVVVGLVFAAPSAWALYSAWRRVAGLARARPTIEQAGFRWRMMERSATVCHADRTVEVAIDVDEAGEVLALQLDVEGPDLPLDATFTREGGLATLVATDLVVGEPRFDDHVRVTAGDPARVRAVLTAECRDAIAAAIIRGGTFERGRWRARLPIHQLPEPAELARLARHLAEAHRALAAAAARDPLDALAAQVRSDRTPTVRLRALQQLVERGIASTDLLRTATRDLDPGVRIAAARALGEEGQDTLLDVVRTGSRTWRVRAAEALARPPLASEALEIVEDTLIAALADPELAGVAARALGRAGTATAVGPLQEAARSGSHRSEASDALAAVRSRLDPGTAGQLSVVDVLGGELAEACGPDGGLSEV